jgi:hypothetical protein
VRWRAVGHAALRWRCAAGPARGRAARAAENIWLVYLKGSLRLSVRSLQILIRRNCATLKLKTSQSPCIFASYQPIHHRVRRTTLQFNLRKGIR